MKTKLKETLQETYSKLWFILYCFNYTGKFYWENDNLEE